MQGNGGVASLSELLGAKLGEAGCGPLLISIDQKHVTPIERACNGQVDRECRLAHAALGIADNKNHASLR